MKRNSAGWLVLLGVFFLVATSTHAATFTIEALSNDTFSPANRTIQVGDRITWVNRGGSHNTVGYLNSNRTTPVWRSALPLSTFSYTFTNAGSYYYECEPHAPGMSGTITVNAAANTPPTVSITAPANNATFTAPATFEVQATAADANGTVASVQFFAGSSSLGTDTTSPFGVTANGLAAGSYALTARATDNAGATTTSSVVNVTVTAPANVPPTVSLTAPANNAPFTAPATFEVQATAADSDGTVASVEFFAGSNSLGTDTSAPFAVTASGLAAGSYALTARAIDNSGATTTSSAVNVTVTDSTGGSITLSNVARAGAGIRFDVTGIAAGRTYRVEVSPDLVTWSTLTTGTAPGGTFTVTDTNPEGAPRRFYRVGI